MRRLMFMGLQIVPLKMKYPFAAAYQGLFKD